METPATNEQCQELKNIKYKTMLMNGGNIENEKELPNSNLDKLELFLETNKQTNKDEPWSKLDKTSKIQKLLNYTSKYAIKNNLSSETKQKMDSFIRECLDKKRIQRVKDVVYDKSTGEITDIPGLIYIKNTKHFTLKNNDKRVSTLKNLPPKNKTKNTENKKNKKDEKEENENKII